MMRIKGFIIAENKIFFPAMSVCMAFCADNDIAVLSFNAILPSKEFDKPWKEMYGYNNNLLKAVKYLNSLLNLYLYHNIKTTTYVIMPNQNQQQRKTLYGAWNNQGIAGNKSNRNTATLASSNSNNKKEARCPFFIRYFGYFFITSNNEALENQPVTLCQQQVEEATLQPVEYFWLVVLF